MVGYIIRRLLYVIPTLLVVSMVAFFIIDLPEGDYIDSYISQLRADDIEVNAQQIASLRDRYGLDDSLPIRYVKWMSGVVQGDFGQSFQHRQPVDQLIWERLGLTLVVATSTILFTWIVALPIGIYSAVKQYSIGDYVATFFGFVGLAIPNFLLALILMYIAFKEYGMVVGGLFSPEFEGAPWSWARVIDMLEHMWIPIIVLGTGGMAGLIRIMRANLLDELSKPYVDTARAKGMPEWRLILKYPVRVALNPFISTIGFILPTLISGAVIVSVVLSLPTTGPLLLQALQSQDMYLAGAFILLLGMLTIIGMLISDILLALLDPRIRFQ